jgi:hypothetical protein
MKKNIIAPLLVATASLQAQTITLQKNNSMEQQQIITTITSIFEGSDSQDWKRVEKAFAPQVTLDYTSMTGGKPATLAPGCYHYRVEGTPARLSKHAPSGGPLRCNHYR